MYWIPVSTVVATSFAFTQFGFADTGSTLKTQEYEKNGWWEDAPPDWMTAPALYPAGAVAASSSACMKLLDDKPDWKADANQCLTQGYETVHLYIALSSDGFMMDHAAEVAERDPWRKSPATRDRVYLLRTQKIDDVLDSAKRLLAECKIVSFIHIDAHGAPGGIAVGHSEVHTVTEFFRNHLTPCVIAPGAKVQFSSCDVACAFVAEPMRNGLEKVFSDTVYKTNQSGSTLDGVSILFNTDTGWSRATPGY